MTGRRLAVAFALALVACSQRATGRTVSETEADRNYQDRIVRVALSPAKATLGATADFQLLATDARTRLAASRDGDTWRLERSGTRVRGVRADGGAATDWLTGIIARVNGNGWITVDGKRHRGDVLVTAPDSELLIVNRVPLELYLRSVVAHEMGTRTAAEMAALQAQAVASRSYAVTRLGSVRAYDLRATTADQVYGGLEGENDQATEAVRSTRGQVLRFGGRVVDAPFHSACGGSTALPSEVWRGGNASYLLRVSDRIGTTDRSYCDIAPGYRWTRTLDSTRLNAALDQYLGTYAAVPSGSPGAARVVAIRERNTAGRVAVLEIETDRGIFPVSGDAIRYVMREPGGEILRSTYFSVEPQYGRDGHVARVTLRGQGNGHGVGMCQWGAIGRARAGQSYQTILRTYYPGTTVGLAPTE